VYTITVVDATHATLDGTAYNAICSPACSGGHVRRVLPYTLKNIVADGAGACTVNLNGTHSLVPGWPFYLAGSTSNALTPGVSTAPPNSGLKIYTVATVPNNSSWTFSCPGVAAGTYDQDYSAYSVYLSVMAFPGVAIAGTGSGAYTSGGTVFSAEDIKNFTEIELYPYDSPPGKMRPRFGGMNTATGALLAYEAPDAAPCTTSLAPSGPTFTDAGGIRSRVQPITGLSPGTTYSFSLACGATKLFSGSFSTGTNGPGGETQIEIVATPVSAAADNLFVDYGTAPNALTNSASTGCGNSSACALRFRYTSGSILWLRRRWCKNRASDPACELPGNQLARSAPQAVTVQ
jgi:hypothetical protein